MGATAGWVSEASSNARGGGWLGQRAGSCHRFGSPGSCWFGSGAALSRPRSAFSSAQRGRQRGLRESVTGPGTWAPASPLSLCWWENQRRKMEPEWKLQNPVPPQQDFLNRQPDQPSRQPPPCSPGASPRPSLLLQASSPRKMSLISPTSCLGCFSPVCLHQDMNKQHSQGHSLVNILKCFHEFRQHVILTPQYRRQTP